MMTISLTVNYTLNAKIPEPEKDSGMPYFILY